MSERARTLTFAAAVLGAAFAAHIFSVQNDFVYFDDDTYVYENRHVKNGLTIETIRWAFTTGHAANYHPITWLSHMADVSLWGLDPMGHHLTNVLLHAASSCLLFFVLLRLTGAKPESFAVALIFAVHPLHVESVAWVSERKDLLCAFFTLVALNAYGRYVRNRTGASYASMCAALVGALLSKPMAATFPFLLLVVDYWPLQRMHDMSLGETWAIRLRRLVTEKVPLFALVACSCVVTFIVQRRGGAMNPTYRLSAIDRFENAIVSYARYLAKLYLPLDLSPIYPIPPNGPALWSGVAAGALLLVVSVAVWSMRKRAPYLLAGWMWYVGMLVPVIGIVQIGYATMADRYMYLPMTGILVAMVWSFGAVARAYGTERVNRTGLAFGLLGLLGLVSLSQQQTAVWHDSESLFRHAIAVTENNAEAHAHLGIWYLQQDRPEDAIPSLEEAVRIRPALDGALTSLGAAYRMMGQPDRAIEAHLKALAIRPDSASIHANLGIAYMDVQRVDDVERHLREALRINPDQENAKKAMQDLLSVRRGEGR